MSSYSIWKKQDEHNLKLEKLKWSEPLIQIQGFHFLNLKILCLRPAVSPAYQLLFNATFLFKWEERRLNQPLATVKQKK